ncbi:MAG: polyamine aminopropyltransferase [Thermodesulfovibrionales bacterium]|nr:polyamine aminopropyltransferase [Thermodesulfovibrionales bacterium]
MLNSKWFFEQTSNEEGSFYSLQEVIYSNFSGFQDIKVIKSGAFGKCLILDGKMQSAESDEFIYHEALIHPSLFSHRQPKRVFIAGGGEGATAREILKHKSVDEIVIVDLDREVIEISKRYLYEWSQGAFENEKVKLYYEDAREFIKREGFFDVIVLDLPEPTEGGPAYLLYTKEFYSLVFDHLTEDGIAVTQAASSAVHNLKVFTLIAKTLMSVFPIVRPYTANIPSFFTPWGFVLASKRYDPLQLSPKDIDRKIKDIDSQLQFYDSETHYHMFSLPKYIRTAIKKQNQIISDKKPVSFY